MPEIKYRGDRTEPYTHAAGTGLIGKVLGPNHNGQYFVVTEANYDAEADVTFATAMLLRRPEDVLDDGGRS